MSGIYIHIPFCKQACHYCDFHFSTSMGKKAAMLTALNKELVVRKEEFKDEVVETIYFGGGTPSVLEVAEIDTLIQTVYAHYNVIKHPEITIEINPDDVSQGHDNSMVGTTEHGKPQNENKLQGYKQVGINRLSIGIQSFFEEDLKGMNRAHNALEATQCIDMAKEYFENISIDLIYGIPDMSEARWRQNIEKALSFGIPHISSYALTVEPKTALANFIQKGKVKPIDDALAQKHFQTLFEVLAANGYDCYEVSNFGKPGFYSKNNTAYWLGKKYLGIGPSAHSYNGRQRSWNSSNNPVYIRSIGKGELPNEVENLSKADRYNEYVMTGLRTSWGVSLIKIYTDFGADYLEYIKQQAHAHLNTELLILEGDCLIATKKGKFLVDGIASDLFMVHLE